MTLSIEQKQENSQNMIVMKKNYKYKREHFKTQEEYERFKRRANESQKRWLAKVESENPERKERRLLRCRLYSRYYWRSDGRDTFSDWLHENYGITDIKSLSIEELRQM